MVRGECKESLSPLYLWKVVVLPGPCRCWEAESSWGIEQEEVADYLAKQHHNASVPSRLPPEPFPLSCLLPLITEFTYCPTGEQKGHFRFAGKEVFIEEKTLACMQTVITAVKVIFTHGSKIWGMEMAKQCRRQPGPI